MKSQVAMSNRFQRAFTLVELLVVVVIIAILAALAIPVSNSVMMKVNQMRTQAVFKDLQVAIGNYRTEYNRFPLNPTELAANSESDIEVFRTDGTGSPDMINILMAKTSDDDKTNPRKVKYIDLPLAKNGLFGVVDNSGGADDTAPLQLVDIWGQHYYVQFDTNFDNRLKNPDVSNNDVTISGKAPQDLSASTLFYSSGPDKIVQTKDDITSWR